MSTLKNAGHADHVVAFKAFFFFLRAYQDAAWVALRDLVDGIRATQGMKKGSMSYAFKKHSRAAAYLLSAVPEYAAWFRDWRELRNTVKVGVNFSSLHWSEPGVCFHVPYEIPNDGRMGMNIGRIVRLGDLAGAYTMMTRIVRAIRAAPLSGSSTT